MLRDRGRGEMQRPRIAARFRGWAINRGPVFEETWAIIVEETDSGNLLGDDTSVRKLHLGIEIFQRGQCHCIRDLAVGVAPGRREQQLFSDTKISSSKLPTEWLGDRPSNNGWSRSETGSLVSGLRVPRSRCHANLKALRWIRAQLPQALLRDTRGHQKLFGA